MNDGIDTELIIRDWIRKINTTHRYIQDIENEIHDINTSINNIHRIRDPRQRRIEHDRLNNERNLLLGYKEDLKQTLQIGKRVLRRLGVDSRQ